MGSMNVFVILREEDANKVVLDQKISGRVAWLMRPYLGYENAHAPIWAAYADNTFTRHIWEFEWRDEPAFNWGWVDSGPYEILHFLDGTVKTGCCAIVTPERAWIDVQVGINYRNRMEEALDHSWPPKSVEDEFWSSADAVQENVTKEIMRTYLNSPIPLKFIVVRCKI
jgi:hypothetical protein